MADDGPDWSDIDDHETPAAFKDYLDVATGADQFQAYKQRSFRRLQLGGGDRVLDAGCGIGDDASALADVVGPDGAVVGIDTSAEMVETARRRATDRPSVTVQVGEIRETGFDADSFDASRADRVFQHLADPVEAIDELKRVTRPGGRIGVSDPDWETLVIDAPGEPPAHDLLDPACSMATNPSMGRELYRLAGGAGLADIDVDPSVFVTTDLELAAELVQFEAWADRVVRSTDVTERDVERWFDRLRRADEAGAFLLSFGIFTVTGTVPAGP